MFRFHLQTVLKARERMSRLRQKDYSIVLARQQEKEVHIKSNEKSLAMAGKKLDSNAVENPDIFAMRQFTAYRERLKSENMLIMEQMREENQELEVKRQNLVEARRAQRSLEILREKQKLRFQQEENRRERAAMDEVASTNYIFRQHR